MPPPEHKASTTSDWVFSAELAARHNMHCTVCSVATNAHSLACCVQQNALAAEVVLVCVLLLWQSSALTGYTQGRNSS